MTSWKKQVRAHGVASPLWSNIYLTPFDHAAMTKAGYRLTRWADDFVVRLSQDAGLFRMQTDTELLVQERARRRQRRLGFLAASFLRQTSA